MEGNRSTALRIHPADNILTVIRAIEAGARIVVEGEETIAATPLPIGHKVAARNIAAGEKIIKYGAPIGSAAIDIPAGAHAHTHNVRSDYIPTFARGEGAHYAH